MAKRKFLTGLLSVTMIGSLVACDPASGSSSSTNSSNNNNGGKTNEVLDSINTAAVATRNKLAQELEKDSLSLKVDVNYSGKQTEYRVEETEVYQGGEWVPGETTTYDPETYSMTEKATLLANLDTKYYTDFLATEGATTLENSTVLFASIDAKAKEFDKDGKETYSGSSLVEAKIDSTSMVARMKSGEITDQTENEVGMETNAQIASVVAGLKAASTMTEEEATAMFKQLLMAQLQLDPTDADQVAYFESLYNTVFGFLDGTVTSEQVADTFLPLIFGGSEEVPEESQAAMKALMVALLDYVKAIEASNVVKFTSRTENGTTFAKMTFDYVAFKSFAEKVFDELTVLFTTNIPEEKEMIEEDMTQFETMFFALLPESVELSVEFGIKNGLFSSFDFDFAFDGTELPYTGGENHRIETDENGNPVEGATIEYNTSFITELEFSSYIGFEFGASAYTIPEFTIPAPVAE